MNNYEEQTDAVSKFYDNFDNAINEVIVREIYNRVIEDIADSNEWNGDEWDEYDNEIQWYKFNRESLDYQAEEETIEEIIRVIFEDDQINVNRLSGDDYLDFEDHIKENYVYLDPLYEDDEDDKDDDEDE